MSISFKQFLIESASNAFDTTTTDMPWYDNMLENPDYFKKEKGVKFTVYNNWSPEKYIQRCIEAKGIQFEELKQPRRKTSLEYTEMMKDGKSFPMVVLDYSDQRFKQEGLHRAFAAIEAGIQTIPVMVVMDSGY